MVLEVDFSRLDAQDALDIAIVIEDEAQLAYEHLAEWVRGDGNTEAAAFFIRMASLEKRHKEQAEVPDYEALGREVALKDAFQVALDAETRAYDFYSEAIEYVDEPTVVELFGWLRDAEIEHKRLLTDEMRRRSI